MPSLNAPQIILEKATTNCFDNPNLDAVLHALGADRYVVYGVATDVCVKFAATGLLRTGRRVEIVEDAIRHITEEGRRSTVADFLSAGGVLTSVAEICG
jgi:nicotinamidase/pyrazinamidase